MKNRKGKHLLKKRDDYLGIARLWQNKCLYDRGAGIKSHIGNARFFGKAIPRGPFKSSPKVCSIPLRVGTDGFGHFVNVVGWNRSSLSSMSTGILMKTGVG